MLLDPPKITVNNGSYEFVAVQSEVTLFCAATAVPSPNWHWLFNGSPISTSVKIDYFENRTTLHFDSFPENMFGNYTCEAENDYDKDSHTTELIRQRLLI